MSCNHPLRKLTVVLGSGVLGLIHGLCKGIVSTEFMWLFRREHTLIHLGIPLRLRLGGKGQQLRRKALCAFGFDGAEHILLEPTVVRLDDA
jgi:hypothetical protein